MTHSSLSSLKALSSTTWLSTGFPTNSLVALLPTFKYWACPRLGLDSLLYHSSFYAFTSSLWQELTKLTSTWISLMAFNSYVLTTSFNMELLILHLPTNPLPATQVFHQSTSQRIFPSKLPISVNLAPNLGGNHPSLSSSSTATSWGLPILYHLALKRIANPLLSPSLAYGPSSSYSLPASTLASP